MEDYRDKIDEIINKMRVKMMKKNITLLQLSRATKISLSTLYNTFKGFSNPRIDTLIIIASALNMKLEVK